MKEFLKQKKIVPLLNPGVAVMIENLSKSTETDPYFDGPFVITKRNQAGSYEVMDQYGTKLARSVPVSQMKVITRELYDKACYDYPVDAILDERIREGVGVEYLCCFVGRGAEYNTWLPGAKVNQGLINGFKNRKRNNTLLKLRNKLNRQSKGYK
eukprot:Nk52_evm32s279 gene=Nk52_evmTU32s279